jgi:HEAT repeat protein
MRFALAILFISAAFAQQPRIANARLETIAVSGLSGHIGRLLNVSSGPEWVGYSEPMIAGEHHSCCWNSDQCCGRCNLESHDQTSGSRSISGGAEVKLEGPQTLVVLLRLSNHAVDKVQAYTLDCELDAGGLPFHWLTGVSPVESVNYLGTLATVHKGAIHAIATQADPAADAVLERLAAPGAPEKQREDVAFWLGSARGRRGVDALKAMLAHDPSDHVRAHIMFALSVSKDPAALAQMLESAHNDPSGHVRSQALFWLAQKAGEKETAAITRAISEDPDTKVKKQAVFALQQLPHDEGIPLLIKVARTNTNPEVRKQAIFWLGQSNDQRALKFFEEVLAK